MFHVPIVSGNSNKDIGDMSPYGGVDGGSAELGSGDGDSDAIGVAVGSGRCRQMGRFGFNVGVGAT
jgi:hypothetical protein